MPVKVTLTLVHHVCPENEYLSDQDLIDSSLDGVCDNPAAWLGERTTEFHATVERDDGDTLTIFETDEYNVL